MSAHSPAAAVMVPVQSQGTPASYGGWLQHIALAVNQLIGWVNQPRLVALTVATLPQEPLPGMIAFVTDCTQGSAVVGGGNVPTLVWYNGTQWKEIAQ